MQTRDALTDLRLRSLLVGILILFCFCDLHSQLRNSPDISTFPTKMFVPPAGVSIPLLTKVRDSADYSLTVQPYISELSTFSQSLFANLLNVEELQNLYASTNPLISALAFSLLISPVFIVLAEFNKNYSQVDRAWSILPAVYHAHYALWARINGVPSSRVTNMFFLSLGWSVSLPIF